MKWAANVECIGLLNMLWVPHFSCGIITTIFLHQLLMLVHDGYIWLGGSILITNMMIHHITFFLYEGVDPTDAFMGKLEEEKLEDRMKSDFKLVKKS